MNFYGLEDQDKFAYLLLRDIRNGFYLDICCQHWQDASNTLVFEEELGWTGFGFDMVDSYPWCGPFGWDEHRLGTFVKMDVNTPEFTDFLLTNVPPSCIVDYISLDVDHQGVNYGWDILPRMINGGIRFKVMTMEHEYHSQGEKVRKPSRELLFRLGYELLFGDVCFCDGKSFEDWWINPKYFPGEILNCGEDFIYHKEAITRLEKATGVEL